MEALALGNSAGNSSHLNSEKYLLKKIPSNSRGQLALVSKASK
jgi:hypothetical protein